MPDYESAFPYAIFTILIILFLGLFIPSLFIATSDNRTTHITHTEGHTETLIGQVNSEVSNVSQQNITVNIIDNSNGSSASIQNLNLSETKNISLDNNQINVTYTTFVQENYVIVEYEYPTYMNWPDGTKVIAKNIAPVLIASLVLLFIGIIFIVEEF